MVKLVGISGSLRKGSTNTGLLRAAQKTLPVGVELKVIDISKLPLYNQDYEQGTNPIRYPEAVEHFRGEIKNADGFVFASPEYNASVTGPLKNAMDWGSRPANMWDNKPAVIVSSGGGFGGYRSVTHLREICSAVNIHALNLPNFNIRRFETSTFNDNGDVIDVDTEERMRKLLQTFIQWVIRLQTK